MPLTYPDSDPSKIKEVIEGSLFHFQGYSTEKQRIQASYIEMLIEELEATLKKMPDIIELPNYRLMLIRYIESTQSADQEIARINTYTPRSRIMP